MFFLHYIEGSRTCFFSPLQLSSPLVCRMAGNSRTTNLISQGREHQSLILVSLILKAQHKRYSSSAADNPTHWSIGPFFFTIKERLLGIVCSSRIEARYHTISCSWISGINEHSRASFEALLQLHSLILFPVLSSEPQFSISVV